MTCRTVFLVALLCAAAALTAVDVAAYSHMLTGAS